jgi:hypothetical protein
MNTPLIKIYKQLNDFSYLYLYFNITRKPRRHHHLYNNKKKEENIENIILKYTNEKKKKKHFSIQNL